MIWKLVLRRLDASNIVIKGDESKFNR
jgi:hypothetical protein